MKSIKITLTLVTLFFVSATFSIETPNPTPAPEIKKLEIMFYNVENLFDNTHDEGKKDWNYLPMDTPGKAEACQALTNPRYRKLCLETDWTPEKLQIKLSRIKDVLLKERGYLPDFLALAEVENENVVAMLAQKLGYAHFVMTDSPDRRGIDVALLYNESSLIKKVRHLEHVLTGGYFETKPTRNILEVDFLIAGKHPLTIYVNHWPSLGNPTRARIAAATKLKSILTERLQQNPNLNVIVTGDFNTEPGDFPHPFKSIITKDNFLFDVHTLFKRDKTIPYSLKDKNPLGSYFYPRKMKWDILDRFFVNKNMGTSTGLQLILRSYKIYSPKFITHTYKYEDPRNLLFGSTVSHVPNRFGFHKTDTSQFGYSDHYPVVVQFAIKN